MGIFKTTDVSKECDRAARILKGFTDKGKIPVEVIANAKGVAIFTGFRAGMYLAGSGGSGVVVARLLDGTWSPPSAFSVRSGSFGLVYGVDVYDCVCVLNTQEAVDAYTKPEIDLGSSVAVAAGPLGASANLNAKDIKPAWTYTKSRGLYGGLTIDGTIIKEKPDASKEFYGAAVTTAQILSGEVRPQEGPNKWPAGSKQLMEMLKKAEGKGADKEILQGISAEPTPGDLVE